MSEHARAGGFFAQACYHAGQAAEKALKGILISLDREPRQTHSLEYLTESLTAAGVATDALEGQQVIWRVFLAQCGKHVPPIGDAVEAGHRTAPAEVGFLPEGRMTPCESRARGR